MLRNKIMFGAGILAMLLMATIAGVILFFTTSCVSPGAVKTEAMAKIASVENNLNKLEKIVDNKADADTIEELRQQLFEVSNTVNNSGVIKYSGAGYVVLGTSLMAIIFLLAIGIFLKYYFKARNSTNMLGLVTTAVKNIDPESQRRVKGAIESQSSNGGPFTDKHKEMLAKFTKANGTFVEKVIKSVV